MEYLNRVFPFVDLSSLLMHLFSLRSPKTPRSLVSLDLSHNNFTHSSDHLSSLLSSSSLTSLNLSFCSLSEPEGEAIAVALRPLHAPSPFSPTSSLSPDLASSLSSSATDSFSRYLSFLDVSENRIGDTMSQIMDSLIQRERVGEKCPPLSSIKADRLNMSAVGFRDVKAKLQHTSTNIQI